MQTAATPLHGKLDRASDLEPFVVKLTRDLHAIDTHSKAFLACEPRERPPGFAAVFYAPTVARAAPADGIFTLPTELAYLDEGDILLVTPRNAGLWVMYRRQSAFNTILLTERCNSWCVMCSQPPKKRDDIALAAAWRTAIPLMSPETPELGISGGEPTLQGEDFLNLIADCRDYLPSTAIHVLSNGRLFNYLSFAQKLQAVGHPDLMLGIPLYSDIAWKHDFVVQSKGAFDQTIRGLLNLARCSTRVELRMVIHRHTFERLPSFAKFVARNLPFVEHVALMGLEPIGFGRTNLASLWVDPMDYQAELAEAAQILDVSGINASIFNHQLCVLPQELWRFSRQSISDWKNIFVEECAGCAVREQCGGFFHSAIHAKSRGIHAFSCDGEIQNQS